MCRKKETLRYPDRVQANIKGSKASAGHDAFKYRTSNHIGGMTMTKRKTNIVMCNGRVLAGRDMRIHDNIKKEIAIFIQNKRRIKNNHGYDA